MSILLTVLAGIIGLFILAGAALALFADNTARRVEAVLPPLGTFIDVEGARIHYVDVGSGPSVLMIHGLGGQMRHFTHSMLERLRGEFRVVVIDRPGSGYSTRVGEAPGRLGAQAESVASLIRALGLDRPILVGHSLGGALALAVALEHPELVRGLALIAPLTQVQVTTPDAFARLMIRSPSVRRLVAWTLATPLAIRGSRAVLAAIFAPEPVPHDFATAGGGLLSLRPGAFYETSSDLVAVNADLRRMVGRYGTLALPIRILFGRDDRILAPSVHGERLAAIGSHVSLELVEGGHMLPLTQPDRAASFVRDAALAMVHQ